MASIPQLVREGRAVTWFDDITDWGNKSADIYLLDGDEDAVCPAWQTEQLAASLRATGYNVELVELHGANHFARPSTTCATGSGR
jgi:dipeptidyl aminopeptidase/acylaminoacyl peptidase